MVGFDNTYRSVIERDFDVLRSIGLNPIEKSTEVFLDGREINWAKEFFLLNGLSQNKKTVVVHPCSSLKIRSWGIDNFTILCKRLVLEGDYQIIINCSPNELDSVAVLKNIVPEVCLFSGSLRELLSLINESDLFIGNDSGPAQFSAALNISTITLNGPSTSSLYRDPDLFQYKHYTLNKEVQEYQSKVAKYGAELQSYQGEVAEQTAEKATIQQNIAYYAQQSDKYYKWAQAEVTQYIQNNSKMINKTMAAQAAQQRR